jgi:N utilization substance protein A
MFEMEIPEITDGIVVIKGVSREAGSRTKISVYSRDESVDPVGACIGSRGMRIDGIIDELCGEKIDIVRYSEVPEEYVTAALSPATVKSVTFDGERSCRVIVDSDQLSLAIGKEGQNARLAARLTGFKIDIKTL